jgi:hypothetical protein
MVLKIGTLSLMSRTKHFSSRSSQLVISLGYLVRL